MVLFLELGFCAEDNPPEQLVVSLDHRSVLSRRLSFEFDANSVQPLGDFFARQTTFAIGDEDSHGAMLSNPSGDDCLNDAGGGSCQA